MTTHLYRMNELCALNFTDKFLIFLSDCQQALNIFRLSQNEL